MKNPHAFLVFGLGKFYFFRMRFVLLVLVSVSFPLFAMDLRDCFKGYQRVAVGPGAEKALGLEQPSEDAAASKPIDVSSKPLTVLMPTVLMEEGLEFPEMQALPQPASVPGFEGAIYIGDVNITRKPLSNPSLKFKPKPWTKSTPGSATQVFPQYVGTKPQDLILGFPGREFATLPLAMKAKAEMQARRLAKTMDVPNAEFEIWPQLDDSGQMNWVFARWRRDITQPWHWLTANQWGSNRSRVDAPILPIRLDPNNPSDHAKIFDDFSTFNDLYQMPEFGQMVFTRDRGKEVVGAWLSPRRRTSMEQKLTQPGIVGYRLPQPARLNDTPVTFTLKANAGRRSWKEKIYWDRHSFAKFPKVDEPLIVAKWPSNFHEVYKERVYQLSGGKDLEFPISGKKVKLTKRSSAQPDHQLEVMNDYFTEFYQSLGLEELGVKIVRQRFKWRGIWQSNLCIVFPGEEAGKYVVAGDHTDAAFEEDTFAKTGVRETTDGAADNITASAMLMATAEKLKEMLKKGFKLKKGVILVHLTGEEYPADGIGVMHFFEDALETRKDLKDVREITAFIVPDFIGYHKPGENIFQLNPADSEKSKLLAAYALDASRKVIPNQKWVGRLVPRNKKANGIFNTDVVYPERLGVPSLLVNNLDYSNNENRKANPLNHQDADTADNVDFDYAGDVSKVGIETILRAANFP